jgi:hypothetical protein
MPLYGLMASSAILKGGRIVTMSIANLIFEIDAEISRLEQARTLLSGISSLAPAAKKRGRPAGAAKTAGVAKAAADKPVKKKRKLSPEGRARIAAAVKARWAAQKKAAEVLPE